MLNSKQFVGIVRSTISIVKEKREALKVVFPLVDRYLRGLSDKEFQSLVQYPTNSLLIINLLSVLVLVM